MQNSFIAPIQVSTRLKIVCEYYFFQEEVLCSTFFIDVLFSKRGKFFVFDDGAILPREENRQWKIQKFNYNNVAAAMLTLFTVQTTEGWPT